MDSEPVDIIAELAAQFRPIFGQSPYGVYLYLDDAHKVCNERLAKLFGYTIEEWRAKQPFQESFVVEEDRDNYCWNFTHRVSTPAFPATFRFRGRRRDGSTFAAETIMIPITGGAILLDIILCEKLQSSHLNGQPK